MTADESITKSETARKPPGQRLSTLIRNNSGTILSWACLIIASLIAFWLTDGTQYHQLAAGILMSSLTLFILIALFESLWWLLIDHNS